MTPLPDPSNRDAHPNDQSGAGRGRETALTIVRTLRDAGFTAYLAGGCVRDELLGYEPKDYDVATSAVPKQICGLFERTNTVGASFGVVLVHEGSVVTEVATFREDGTYSDHRRPDFVSFSTPEADAERRDFTINALFRDPLDTSEPLGKVIDYVEGRRDLENHLIRAVGDPASRLREDHLRALRAVRFACRLGFDIESGTADAIRAHASALKGVSSERVGDEMRRMLTHPERARASKLLEDLELDRPILGPPRSEPVLQTVLNGLSTDARFEAALCALAIDRGFDPCAPAHRTALLRDWRASLCLSNTERDTFANTLRTLADLRQGWAEGSVAQQKRIVAREEFPLSIDVLRGWDPTLASDVLTRIGELEAIGAGISPAPLLDGNALISIGITPGPIFKRVLDGVYDAQLEDKIRDLDGAIALARELSAS